MDADALRTQTDNLRSQLKSPHFFSMTGIPKFGKSWLDNFIPDEELQNTFLTSEVVRNVIMLQCVWYTSVYGEILQQVRGGSGYGLIPRKQQQESSSNTSPQPL